MQALIFANGKAKHGSMVARALSQSEQALIVAADGGARIAWHYDKTPDIVIGDMDSLSQEERSKLERDGAQLLEYPPEKDETDLELALLYAAEQGASWIRIIGALGGRFDQMMANVYLLAMPELEQCDVALVAGEQMIRLLHTGAHDLIGTKGDTISLIPISGDVIGISTKHMQYPLEDETLRFGPARGISNVMTNNHAQVMFREGMVLCVHTEGEA